MDRTPAYPHIPYGQGDFRRIRLNRWLYVDKTRFLRRLEREHFALLIRPRRFGKTLWVSLLENYYDRWWGHEFEAVFAGTDIGQDATEEPPTPCWHTTARRRTTPSPPAAASTATSSPP